jgi:hypothetical protein
VFTTLLLPHRAAGSSTERKEVGSEEQRQKPHRIHKKSRQPVLLAVLEEATILSSENGCT